MCHHEQERYEGEQGRRAQRTPDSTAHGAGRPKDDCVGRKRKISEVWGSGKSHGSVQAGILRGFKRYIVAAKGEVDGFCTGDRAKRAFSPTSSYHLDGISLTECDTAEVKKMLQTRRVSFDDKSHMRIIRVSNVAVDEEAEENHDKENATPVVLHEEGKTCGGEEEELPEIEVRSERSSEAGVELEDDDGESKARQEPENGDESKDEEAASHAKGADEGYVENDVDCHVETKKNDGPSIVNVITQSLVQGLVESNVRNMYDALRCLRKCVAPDFGEEGAVRVESFETFGGGSPDVSDASLSPLREDTVSGSSSQSPSPTASPSRRQPASEAVIFIHPELFKQVRDHLQGLHDRIENRGRASLLPSTAQIGTPFIPALKFLVSSMSELADQATSEASKQD